MIGASSQSDSGASSPASAAGPDGDCRLDIDLLQSSDAESSSRHQPLRQAADGRFTASAGYALELNPDDAMTWCPLDAATS